MNSATERSTHPAAAPTASTRPTDDTLGDPPPYTPNPSFMAGESTLEQGPARFQSIPTGQNNASQSRPSLLQVLNNSFNDFITQLDNSRQPRPSPQHTWTAYPGQQALNSHSAFTPIQTGTSPPSTSVRSPLPMRASDPSSDFIRDFYAAGTGDTGGLPPAFVPPPGPPPRLAEPESHQTVRKPTSFPVVGHPLLRDGKLLVYPRNYKCDKCHNIGYKDAEPSRPCKRCWNNYAKPFSGPLAYAFSSFSDEGSFQRPLPALGPGGFGGAGYSQDRSESFLARQPTDSSFSYQPHVMSNSNSVPPRSSVVYNAGDPRIGGVLCWQCRGKGNVSFLFDRINCDICGGVGRVFNS